MLNTFFFGYLSLKWRRLIRTLFLLPYIPFSIVVFYKWDDPGLIFSMIFAPILFATLSWVIKPFAMDENKFKPELYTFFFGYLSLKWRRLVRTLLLLPTISFQLFMIVVFLDEIWNFYFLRLLLLSLFIFNTKQNKYKISFKNPKWSPFLNIMS